VSWRIITDDWRLKLLALGLAVLMLGAVAFSQNPPTSGSQTVNLTYADIPPTLILINPPSKTTVTYTGVADAVSKVTATCGCLTATVDVSHAKPGTNVQLTVVAKTTVADVTAQNPPPVSVNIDTYVQAKELQVQPSARPAAGWAITQLTAECPNTPCLVHFSGPASWLKNMTATVTYPSAVSLGSIDSPNLPIQLVNSNGSVDLTTCRTDPCAFLDTLTATIHIEAVPGSNTTSVVLLASPWTHGPASGYRVTDFSVTPNTVIISGDPVQLSKIRNITLPAVDLSGRTSDTTFTINIPYPDGISGTVATATLKYSISPNPNLAPSPTPT
jgi:YbbR domain-containing protein